MAKNRDHEILSFIQKHLEEKGISPSIREIARHIGISSSGALYKHIKRLIQSGKLTSSSKKWRTLSIESHAKDTLHVQLIGSIKRYEGLSLFRSDTTFELPRMLVHSQKPCYALQIDDESFTNDSIIKGDLLILSPELSESEGTHILVELPNKKTIIARLFVEDEFICLAENDSQGVIWHKYLEEEITIHGEILALFRSFYSSSSAGSNSSSA